MSRTAADSSRDASRTAGRDPFAVRIFPAVLCLLGTAVMFHPMLRSGLALMPGDFGDARFNNYVLEHTYRWLIGDPPGRSLWSMPIFYPAPRAAFYSDVFLGVAPLYWLFRLFSFSPETAFQLWMLAAAVLNYAAFYLLLADGLRLPRIPAAGGSALFAFAGMRTVQIGHQQLLSEFYLAIAAWALLKVMQRAAAGRSSSGWLMLAAMSVTLQAYSGFYYFWFFMFCVGVLLICMLLDPSVRAELFAAARLNWRGTAASACAAALLLLPLAQGYRSIVKEIGYRDFGQVHAYLVPLRSWFLFEPSNLLYGWTSTALQLRRGILLAGEKQLGVGLLTLACVAAGFAAMARRRGGRPAALAALAVAVLITVVAGRYTLWSLVYLYVPGAPAVRAVSRMALVLLIPASIALALFLQRRRPGAAAVLCLFCLLEQVHSFHTYDKDVTQRTVREIAGGLERASSPCRAFIYSQAMGQYPDWKYHIDAMWVELAAGIPTMNGYSGNRPADWPLAKVSLHRPSDETALAETIRRWGAARGLPPGEVCWVRRFYRGADAVLLSRPDEEIDQRRWVKKGKPRPKRERRRASGAAGRE